MNKVDPDRQIVFNHVAESLEEVELLSVQKQPAAGNSSFWIHALRKTWQANDRTTSKSDSDSLAFWAMAETENQDASQIRPEKVTTWFPNDDKVVFYSPDAQDEAQGQPPLTYAGLQKQIQTFPLYKIPATVAILLPTSLMAELAVLILALLDQQDITVAPLDPNMPTAKIWAAMDQMQCTALVTTQDLFTQHFASMTNEDGNPYPNGLTDIRIISVNPASDSIGTFSCHVKQYPTNLASVPAKTGTPTGEKPALLLRTSGTTSTPKVVPWTRKAMLYNALCLARSLELSRNDIACNAMPLYHIGGLACAVLAVVVSGSAAVMLQGTFEPQAFLKCLYQTRNTPTWFSGVPSMHKALVLTLQAQHQAEGSVRRHALRFIRSGAAYLSRDLARQVSAAFDHCPVISTYSMSECMPICSAYETPVRARLLEPSKANAHAHDANPTDSSSNNGILTQEMTVGSPVGCHLAIVDQDGVPLPFGSVGEVAIRGPGVMDAYVGIPKSESHTLDGFFKTGDMGSINKNGHLFLAGRVKEMIKRGGEQVWPNEIDKVVERVPGVAVAVTFGVPNPLWEEEVAVAVVRQTDHEDSEEILKRKIMDTCRLKLDKVSIPSQIILLNSTSDLLRGTTGKYIRTKMASHLGVKAVDTVALHALETMANGSGSTAMVDREFAASPSEALNGVRLLVAFFVVMGHIGLYPNIGWLKVQAFLLCMQTFFVLGAFQVACATRTSDLNWSQFVGNKIGVMHGIFLISQLIALPSFLLQMCGPTGYYEVFENHSCTKELPLIIPAWVFKTATGLTPLDCSNIPTWFQGAFYMFLIIFPWLNSRLHSASSRKLAVVFTINLFAATVICAAVLFQEFTINYYFVSWLPVLVCAVIAGNVFSRSESSRNKHPDRATFWQKPQTWGIITDLVSVICLLLEVAVVLSPDCLTVHRIVLEEMRPDAEELQRNDEYLYICSVTHDEFVDFIFDGYDPDLEVEGKYYTTLGILAFMRLLTPLSLIWVYGMAYGHGWTSRLFSLPWILKTSYLAYPLYLLHVPIARFWWYFTRGPDAQSWFLLAAVIPFPVEWYEVLIIIAISLFVAALLDHFVLPYLSRYTVLWGVSICRFLMRHLYGRASDFALDGSVDAESGGNLAKVQLLVQGLTGSSQVDRSTNLRDSGLDSLGATALLSILKANIPSAKSVNLSVLSQMETVGDLVDFLDRSEEDSGRSTVILPF